ncbi:BrnT family toxin [Candidatus Merdisoma sp. JLR.KK011]|uniref:BrnT family toxin n=1 Tax=Candidatus Merdisoma sp. JLR.KK011 TaxID=3114299 RepID=UPI002FF2189A
MRWLYFTTKRKRIPYILSIFQNYIEMFDFEHSVDEDRYIAIGKVGDVLFVVFTERKETIRLISARLATNAEKELYYDQNINY